MSSYKCESFRVFILYSFQFYHNYGLKILYNLYLKVVIPTTYEGHKKLRFLSPQANFQSLTTIFGGKRLQMTLSKFPVSNFTGVNVRSTIIVDQSHQSHEKNNVCVIIFIIHTIIGRKFSQLSTHRHSVIGNAIADSINQMAK